MGIVMMEEDKVEKVAHAIADPIRLKILDLLARGRSGAVPPPPPKRSGRQSNNRGRRGGSGGGTSPVNPEMPSGMCACDLRPHFGKIVPSKLAYHLKELREAGLVNERPRGRWVYYSLNQVAIRQFSRDLLARLHPGQDSKRKG